MTEDHALESKAKDKSEIDSINSVDLKTPKATLETGRLARISDSAVTLSAGSNKILVTCCYSKEPKPGSKSFFPLTVDFEEKSCAFGLIPGGYNKREGKPTERAILSARLIDRAIRPLFPAGFFNEVQVIVSVLSSDRSTPLDVLAICGASAALELSGLPILESIGALRVGLVDQEFVVNPSYQELQKSKLDLVVAGTKENILMVEAGASFVKEETVIKACRFAQGFISEQIEKIKELARLSKSCSKKLDFEREAKDSLIDELVHKKLERAFQEIIAEGIKDKKLRDHKFNKELKILLAEEELLEESKQAKAKDYANELLKKLLRQSILEQGVRIDGRSCEEIRAVSSEVSFLPRVHGSGLFNRGLTQVLSSVTLGTDSDSRPVEGLLTHKELRYFHDYSFPPFSVGETRPLRSPGRREIGHGALAERALLPALPSKEEFPYVIRVVSEALSSDGSTSMGSTCGSTLALMDAGVPLKEPISGIAMGLIFEKDKFAVLSDIQGIEDFLGDMDFKVTGGKSGLTALQLDVKLKSGIPADLLSIALEQARLGRGEILEKMLLTIAEPREHCSEYAPLIYHYRVDPPDISGLIGSGGKNIKELIRESGVKEINISQDGLVTIVGDQPSVSHALESIKSSTVKIIPGKEYKGKIIRKTADLIISSVHGKDALFKMFNPHKFAHYEVGDAVIVLVRDFSRGKVYVSRIRKEAEIEIEKNTEKTKEKEELVAKEGGEDQLD